MIKSKKKFTVVTFCIIVVIVFVIDFLLRLSRPPFEINDFSRSKGNPDAPIQVVEFVDFQCLQCAHGYRYLKKFMEEYPDEMFLSIKYYPLSELNSAISARYAHCASLQDKFWLYHDLLFEKQITWRTLENVEPYLKSLAKDVALDSAQLDQCVNDPKTQKAVFQDRILGDSHFVNITPTYFVNNEVFVGVEELKRKMSTSFGYDG